MPRAHRPARTTRVVVAAPRVLAGAFPFPVLSARTRVPDLRRMAQVQPTTSPIPISDHHNNNTNNNNNTLPLTTRAPRIQYTAPAYTQHTRRKHFADRLDPTRPSAQSPSRVP